MENPQKLRRVLIKEELVELTGSIDGAIVLGQMKFTPLLFLWSTK